MKLLRACIWISSVIHHTVWFIRNFENFKVKLNKPDWAWFRSEASWCWSHIFSCISRLLSHASFPSIKKRIWHLLNDWINVISPTSGIGSEIETKQKSILKVFGIGLMKIISRRSKEGFIVGRDQSVKNDWWCFRKEKT